MKKAIVIGLVLVSTAASAGEIGRFTVNPYVWPNQNTITPYPYSNAPNLYDQQGNYRGRLSSDPYGQDSISNPYGRYGSRYSNESVNNPFGAGSRFKLDSPNNPFGKGWKIVEP